MRQLVFLINCTGEYLSHSAFETSPQEAARFFMSISEVYLPLLNMFKRLKSDNIPFKISIVLPSAVLSMLDDAVMQSQFIDYLDWRIQFGESCQTLCMDEEKDALKTQIDGIKEKKELFEHEYNRKLLNAFAAYRESGDIEILATCATNIFLPHYIDIEETLCAQIETGLYAYKTFFADKADGFYLPEMGYQNGLEKILSSYGVRYTVLDGRAVLFSKDTAPCGIFSPVLCDASYKTSPLAVFARDNRIQKELFGEDKNLSSSSPNGGYAGGSDYCNIEKDLAFSVQADEIYPFIPRDAPRFSSGYRCWNNAGKVYNKSDVQKAAARDASSFIKDKLDLFSKAYTLLSDTRQKTSKQSAFKPLSLTCVINANDFIDKWPEGLDWLENVFIKGMYQDMEFATFKEVLNTSQNMATIRPYFSADCGAGYAEVLNSGNNCWMLPLVRRASKRMTSLADRFSDGSTIKARLLNAGAKELLLAQSSAWQKRINDDPKDNYALEQFWNGIKAFTTVFEDLGSNTFSPSWLTALEGKRQIFPWINYKIFCKKR